MIAPLGEVPEWSNGPDSKSGVRVSVPWVRIPPSPPSVTESILLLPPLQANTEFSVSHFLSRVLAFSDFEIVSLNSRLVQKGRFKLSFDNLRARWQTMARKRHPIKEIEDALKKLEELGWSVQPAKGQRSHSWGFVLCPAKLRSACRDAVFCRMSVWSTPRDPRGHARELLRKAQGCVVTGEDHGQNDEL